MNVFKVALVTETKEDLPDWVVREINVSGILLEAKKCLTPDDVLAIGKDADVIWTRGRNEVITEAILPELKNCKAILRSGSGLDGMPIEAAKRLGIKTLNTPEAIAESVAEHTVALLLALTRQIPQHDQAVRGGSWESEPKWAKWHVSRQTLGLVGFGHIAQKVLKMLQGFDMQVLVFDPYTKPETVKAHGAQSVPMEDLLKQSDFISLHCPLTEQTYHLVGEKELKIMKPTAFIINTSRGQVIDEKALLKALTEGWIAGAGLDVLEQEAPNIENPLYQLGSVIITPHIAAFADDFWQKFWACSIQVLQRVKADCAATLRDECLTT